MSLLPQINQLYVMHFIFGFLTAAMIPLQVNKDFCSNCPYTKGNMFWHPVTFSMRNLMVFAKLCPHHKYKDTKLIHHFKALIFSSLELQGQRARPPNKASTPS